MPEKMEVVISVTVKQPGYHYGKDKIEGEAEAVYTLPDLSNLLLPHNDTGALLANALEEYRLKQAEAKTAETEEQDTE